MASTSSIKTISLSDYKDILLTHEKEYHLSKGGKCQEVLEQIIADITSQGKGKLSEDVMKGIESVSSLAPIEFRNLIHLDSENPNLVQQPQECPIGG